MAWPPRRRCARERPPSVIVLTTFNTDDDVFHALEAGATGFLLKDTPPTELLRAVRLAAAGDSMLSPGVTRQMIDRYTAQDRTRHRREALARLQALIRAGTAGADRDRPRTRQCGDRHAPAHQRGN